MKYFSPTVLEGYCFPVISSGIHTDISLKKREQIITLLVIRGHRKEGTVPLPDPSAIVLMTIIEIQR